MSVGDDFVMYSQYHERQQQFLSSIKQLSILLIRTLIPVQATRSLLNTCFMIVYCLAYSSSQRRLAFNRLHGRYIPEGSTLMTMGFNYQAYHIFSSNGVSIPIPRLLARKDGVIVSCLSVHKVLNTYWANIRSNAACKFEGSNGNKLSPWS